MFAYTSIPLKFQKVPVRAVVQAVYATARNPFSHTLQRVRVEGVRLVNILGQGGQPSYKVAAVIGIDPGITQGYDVRVETLLHVSAFVACEVRS